MSKWASLCSDHEVLAPALTFLTCSVQFSELIRCMQELSPAINGVLNKAGVFGDLVQKGISELLAPHKCTLCASKLTDASLDQCGCGSDSRRLSADIFFAKETFGSFVPSSNVDSGALQQPPTFHRQLISSPVTNNLETCPNAPGSSQEPAYSTKYDIFYSDLLSLPSKDIYPNFYFKNVDTSGQGTCSDLNTSFDPIVKPNENNGFKWDTRTNQVSIFASVSGDYC